MNKKSTKALASATLMSLVLTTALTAGPVKAAAGSATRVSGADRYETAANVATSNWTTSDNVVLVSGQGYADAVSASALAKQLNAPILLTTPDTLSASTSAALTKLQAKNIYVVGGTASVSQSVRDQLKKSYTLTELSGNTRYETNVAVANELVKLGVKKDNVLVVGGNGFSDALSVAPIASAKGEILLLADNDQSDSKGAIDFANGSNVTVVGTSNVISDAIKGDFSSTATRVDGGADRFATNLNVLNNFKSDLKADKLYVANASGNGYADALVASAIAGKTASPLVLVDSDSSDATTNAINYMKSEATKTTDTEVVGGTGVISDTLLGNINSAIYGTTPTTSAQVQSISTNGLNQIKVVFNQEVDQDTAEDVSNYEVDGAQLDGTTNVNAKASLQDDNKTVLITLKTPEKQSDDVDVKVRKGILTADKSQTVPEFTQSVTFSDTTAPTITSVTARGNKKLDVKFSEPVKASTVNDVVSKLKINGDNLSSLGIDTGLDGNNNPLSKLDDAIGGYTDEVELYFDSALTTGNNTLKVSTGDSTSLENAAGFPIQEATQDFNVDTLTTTPQITSITSEDDGTVYVNFDRPMDAKTATTKSYYAINSSDNTGNFTKVELKKDDTQVKISGATLNKNSNTIYVKNNVKDAYGNKVADDTYKSFDLSEDTTKPAVTSVSALNDTTIRVRFNKNVDAAFAESKSNYKLQDNSGTDITNNEIDTIAMPSSTDTTGDVFDIKLGTDNNGNQYKLTDSKYTLTIKNIRDTASTPNVMDDYTTTFTGSSDVNAEVTGVYKVNDSSYPNRKISMTFNKEMDSSTLGNTSNYQYVNKSGDTKVLPSSSEISVSSDNKSVTITLPDAYTTDSSSSNFVDANKVTGMYATGVKDTNGNALEVGNQGGSYDATSPSTPNDSIKVYYDGDDLKADVSFPIAINPDSLVDTNGASLAGDFKLGDQPADSASVNGNKLTLTFNSASDDSSNASTKINKIKALGEDATLTIAGTDIKDVTGATVSTDGTLKPYYYDAVPKTIVQNTFNQAANLYVASNLSANATDKTVTVKFDTPIADNSLRPSDFVFSVGGTTLSATKAEIDSSDTTGTTVKFTLDNTDSNISKFVANGTNTIKVTPKSTTQLSTKKDRNGDYAYYTPSSDDLKGISILITAN